MGVLKLLQQLVLVYFSWSQEPKFLKDLILLLFIVIKHNSGICEKLLKFSQKVQALSREVFLIQGRATFSCLSL